MGYQRRTVDDELDQLLPGLAAIALEGAKGVGKTATAEQRAATVLRLDDAADRTAVAADPRTVLAHPRPVLVDEWQLVPEVWDVVRRQVDRDATPGQLLLTGSATASPGARLHSGAGRIVRLRLRPMTLEERGVATPSVHLSGLLTGARAPVHGSTNLTLADYVETIVSSGLPGVYRLPPRVRTAQLDSYVTNVVDREIPELGVGVRHPEVLRAWMTAYAAVTATTTSYNRILDAATAGEDTKPAKATVQTYRSVLERLWLLDPVPGWVPTLTPLSRLVQAQKHHLVDPGLAAQLLGATPESLLRGGPVASAHEGRLLGALFESLATLCVRTAAQAAGARVHHLRTRGGEQEVDLIVERPDHRVLAIEVKLGVAVDDDATRHLRWLRREIGDRLLDAVVLTTGSVAHRRPDGVAVVPLGLLGA